MNEFFRNFFNLFSPLSTTLSDFINNFKCNKVVRYLGAYGPGNGKGISVLKVVSESNYDVYDFVNISVNPSTNKGGYLVLNQGNRIMVYDDFGNYDYFVGTGSESYYYFTKVGIFHVVRLA